MITRRGFWFLRHGETDWNCAGNWQGQSDVPLNVRGEAQAAAAIPLLRPLGIEAICASRLKRARRTADIIAEALALPVTEVPGLEEMSVGPYEGSAANHWLDDWRADRNVAGVESFPDFRRRVGLAVNRAMDHAASVLVVAHGGVFWALEHLCGTSTFTPLRHCVPARLSPLGETRWQIDLLAGETD